ncbi:MAG: gamma-glutamylcyclotransferase [Planctomycetes bacterium]|nr:gamma-glutamylcyclotransferase [Planctomycetota bacterium]
MSEEVCVWVFVYGTLKRGGVNHDLIGAHVLEALSARLPDHALWCNGAYPGARSEPDAFVEGEVLRLRDRGFVLSHLDRLEGHPLLYRRREGLVQTEAQDILAWFYVLNDLNSGSWRRLESSLWRPRNLSVKGQCRRGPVRPQA